MAPQPIAPAPAQPRLPASASAPRLGHAAGLEYLEVELGAARANERLPLVMFIHGRGDHAHTAWLYGLSARARFVFPQAPTPYGRGFTWFSDSVAESDPEQLSRDIEGSALQLVRALAELQRTRPTRGKPILAGFSQGAILTYALALLHPDTLAYGIPIAGMLPSPLQRGLPRAGVHYPPLRALHGRADDVIPFAPTEQMVTRLRARGLDIQLRAFDSARHELNAPMRSTLQSLLNEALAEH